MMVFKIKLVLILLFLIQLYTSQENKWIINIQQIDNPINTINLHLGLYSKITIQFTKNTPTTTDVSGTLTLNSQEVQLINEDPILFDTSKSTSIEVYIGRSCSKPITGESLEFQMQFQPDPLELFIINHITTTVQIKPFALRINQKDKVVSFNHPSTLSITPVTEPMMNIDPITVTFSKVSTNSIYSYANDYMINKYPLNSNSLLETIGEFGIKEFDYIIYNQKFTGEFNEDTKKCFTLTNEIEFSMDEESISSITNEIKQNLIGRTSIADENNDYSLALSISDVLDAFPLMTTCAAHCRSIEITDDDILQQNRYEYHEKELQYHKAIFTSEHPVNFKYNKLSRLCLLRIKCLFNVEQTEAFTPLNFKSTSLTIGSYREADIKREIIISTRRFIPINCITWEFNKAFKSEEFEATLQKHIKDNIKPHKEDISLDCLKFTHSFNETSDTITTICLDPNEECKFNYPYHYYKEFKSYYEKLNTTQAVKEAFKLIDNELMLKNSFHETDYQMYNFTDLSGEIISKSDTHIKIKLTTKGLPAECYLKNIDGKHWSELFEEDFYEPKNKVKMTSYKSDPEEVELKIESYLPDDKIYDVYINCHNLPNFHHHHHFFPHKLISFLKTPTPIIPPDKETLEDCNKVLRPYCKQHKLIEYPLLGRNPIASLNEYTQFKGLSINEQLFALSLFSLKDNFLDMSLLSSQLALMKCIECNSYTECRKIKSKQIQQIMALINSKYTKIYSDESIEGVANLEEYRFNYTNALFFLSQNIDSFNSNDAKSFMELIFSYVLDSLDVLLSRFTSLNKESVLILFSHIANNIVDLGQYLELEGELTAHPDENTRLLVDDLNLKSKKALEAILIRLQGIIFPKNYTNFNFNFHDFASLEAADSIKIQLEDLDSSSIEIPLNELKAKGVDQLLTMAYSTYPLLSFNNTVTNSKVISISAFDKTKGNIDIAGLSLPVKIHYGNLKENDEMRYCGYINATNQISTEGVDSKLNESNIVVCETNHFSDFIVSKFNLIDGNPVDEGFDIMKNLWWIILLIVMFLLIFASLGIYYCRTMRNEGPHGKLTQEDIQELPILYN